MRSSVLLTSALAAGAIAGPIERRKVYTETQVTVETITVYVTAGQPLPSASAEADVGNHYGHKASNRPSSAAASVSSAAPVAPVSTPEPTSVVPEASSSSSTSVAYTPVAVEIPSSSAPSSSATPTSSAVPTTTVAPTTSAAPTTTAAPTSSSSSQAAAATSSSALAYGVTHTSGTVQATFHEGDEYKNSVLWHHNRARANHGASNLEWSDECESAAQTAAAYCDFEHHVVDGQGQNLFTTSGDAYNVTAGITDSWYKGEADIYTWWGEEPPHSSSDSASLDMETFEKYGHTTQMLWKSTTSVGCVTIDCGSKMTVSGASSTMGKYTVCNYSPPGNYVGEFAKNVAAPSGAYSGYSWSD